MPKKEKIQEMFDRIAPSYDRLNHLMSLNVDKRWRREALREIVDGTPQRILDVACGTGDSTIAIARAAAEGSRVTGVDISEGMMGLVMDKAHQDRVLVPGGKAVILELSVPRPRVVRWVYDLYFLHILPRIGAAVSGDKAAYAYLPASVHAFPAPEVFMEMMKSAGFSRVRSRSLSLGLCRIFVGEK